MANLIKIRRGLYSDLPSLAEGELGFCTDNYKVFIGSSDGNKELITDLSGAVLKSDFNADSFLYASSAGDPASKTPSEVLALLSGVATADFDINSHKILNLANPVNDSDAVNKSYVDTKVAAGLSWLEIVLDKDILDPSDIPSPGPLEGDRYWIGGTGAGDWSGHDYDVAEYNGSGWDFYSTSEGDCAYVDDENLYYFLASDGTLKKLAMAMGPHHATHEAGGSDEIKLDKLAAPDDVTTLNATTSAHGLLPKLDGTDTHFLNGEGEWVNAYVPDGLIKTGTLTQGNILSVNDVSGIMEDSGLTATGATPGVLLTDASTIDGGTFV